MINWNSLGPYRRRSDKVVKSECLLYEHWLLRSHILYKCTSCIISTLIVHYRLVILLSFAHHPDGVWTWIAVIRPIYYQRSSYVIYKLVTHYLLFVRSCIAYCTWNLVTNITQYPNAYAPCLLETTLNITTLHKRTCCVPWHAFWRQCEISHLCVNASAVLPAMLVGHCPTNMARNTVGPTLNIGWTPRCARDGPSTHILRHTSDVRGRNT